MRVPIEGARNEESEHLSSVTDGWLIKSCVRGRSSSKAAWQSKRPEQLVEARGLRVYHMEDASLHKAAELSMYEWHSRLEWVIAGNKVDEVYETRYYDTTYLRSISRKTVTLWKSGVGSKMLLKVIKYLDCCASDEQVQEECWDPVVQSKDSKCRCAGTYTGSSKLFSRELYITELCQTPLYSWKLNKINQV